MAHISAIVLAAGKGKRFSTQAKSNRAKLLAEINSQPVIIHSLKSLSSHPWIKEIILVVNAENKKQFSSKIKQYRITKISSIVNGGLRRQDSVSCGLKAVNRQADIVLIHDAARPFISRELISRVILEAKKSGAAIAGVPVKCTIKSARLSKSHRVMAEETLDRSKLWEIQTPQVFKKDLILKAYHKFIHADATDDAMLVEKLGKKVSIVMGSYRNIKITTSEDLLIGEAICHLK